MCDTHFELPVNWVKHFHDLHRQIVITVTFEMSFFISWNKVIIKQYEFIINSPVGEFLWTETSYLFRWFHFLGSYFAYFVLKGSKSETTMSVHTVQVIKSTQWYRSGAQAANTIFPFTLEQVWMISSELSMKKQNH